MLSIRTFFRHCSTATKALPSFRHPSRDFEMYPNFISAEEEMAAIAEIDCLLGRTPYERGHFDQVITGYRERLLSTFKGCMTVEKIFKRYQEAFEAELSGLSMQPVHVLDLQPQGLVKPHVDQYCSGIIGAVSLGGDAVMSFEPVKGYTEHEAFNVTIPAKSLYIQKCRKDMLYAFDRLE